MSYTERHSYGTAYGYGTASQIIAGYMNGQVQNLSFEKEIQRAKKGKYKNNISPLLIFFEFKIG